MLAATAFERMELEGFPRARIADLKSIALDPIDFDSRTPDEERFRVDENAKKAAWCGLKREPAIKLDDDWWGGFEEESLGTILFGMDACA